MSRIKDVLLEANQTPLAAPLSLGRDQARKLSDAGQKAGDEDKTEEKALLDQWEAAGRQEAITLNAESAARSALPQELTLSGGVVLYLATLKGQSPATGRAYRAGCRRFLWFIYSSGRGIPDKLRIQELSPLVLEEFYLWMVDTFGQTARGTHSNYLAATRNLFEFLASRELTPQGCQYQKMIARLSKLQGRASYRTPRVRGRQVEQVAKLAMADLEPAETSELSPENNGHMIPPKIEQPSELVDEADSLNPKSRKARSPEEIERQKLEEKRDRAIVLTLFTTGMRRQELAQLNRVDLDNLLEENELELCKVENKDNPNQNPSETSGGKVVNEEAERVYELLITGKGQKERLVYFDKVTLEAISEYLSLRGKDSYRPLFLQHHRGRDKVKVDRNGEKYRVSLVTVWQVVVKYAQRLGVEVKPHDFRHNLATTLLNAGAQLSEVQDILGHASPTTTKQIYAHYDKSHLRQAFARFRKGADELS